MKNKDGSTFKTFYFLSLAWQLGFIIVVPIVGFLLIGRWLDGIFGTEPFLFILGIILGLVMTVFEVY